MGQYIRPDERMTKEEAERAKATFEFPPFKCVGIEDCTDTEDSWALQIADTTGQVRLFTAAHWNDYFATFFTQYDSIMGEMGRVNSIIGYLKRHRIIKPPSEQEKEGQ